MRPVSITSRAASRRYSGVYVFLFFVPITDILPDRPTIKRNPSGQCPESGVNPRTREGWLYCCCVLDAFSRKIVGWSIDSSPDTRLVLNALDMAIKTRNPAPGGIVHADHGAQFTSWAFGNRIRQAGLMPSFGTVGDGLDNAMMESFWSSMQIELLDRQRWNTRVELANAIFEYIEVWHNRARRHSSIGYLAPVDFELQSQMHTIPARTAHLIR